MSYIYKITNQINGKIYIGKTSKTIDERFKEHIKKAKLHTNRYLYDAMNHYGYHNFSIEKVEECENDLLNEREKYWISHYNSFDKNFGYNMTTGGEGGDTWSKNSNKELTLMKLIVANRGKKRSKEFCENLSKRVKGKHYGSEFGKRVAEARKNNLAKERGYASWNDRTKYISDCKKLFMQIPKSQCVNKIEKEHKSKGKVYEEIYSDEYAKIKRQKMKEKWLGDNNPNYVYIDKDILLYKILNNEKVDDIAQYFNTSKQTLFNKCNEYFGTRKTREVKKKYGERI